MNMKTVHKDGRTTLVIDHDKVIDEITKLAVNKSPEPDAKRRLLKDAMEACCGDRHLNYGKPEENFTIIAELWNSWMVMRQGEVLDYDVPALMILMKLARLSHTPDHRDSIVDIAGYAACWADLLEGKHE